MTAGQVESGDIAEFTPKLNRIVSGTTSPAWSRLLASDAAARLRASLARWARLAPGPSSARAAEWIAPILEGDGFRALSAGPVRCWAASVEDALAMLDAARSAARGGAGGRSLLVDRVADAGVLAELAPGGRIPPDFPSRAGVYGRRCLSRLAAEVPLYAAPWLAGSDRPRAVRVPFVADLDLGRPADELDVPDAGVRFLRRGGSPFARVGRSDLLPPLPDGSRYPTTGAVLRARGTRVYVGRRDRAFDSRVPGALDLLEAAWPEGAFDVRALAWRVVPVTDWATVSYSSARRPGVLYIHVHSRPLVRLAEDLLHETVHVRLHAVESIRSLAVPRGESGEEPRFWSPWRMEWRPVRGLLHGACTFAAGEEFFHRMLAAADAGTARFPPARRLWLAGRLLEERTNVGIALRALDRARRQGLLTPAGRELVEAARAAHASLSAPASRRRRELARTAKGREVLEHLHRFREAVRRRPLRWNF
jgi:HEXXH motif-containing protein